MDLNTNFKLLKNIYIYIDAIVGKLLQYKKKLNALRCTFQGGNFILLSVQYVMFYSLLYLY